MNLAIVLSVLGTLLRFQGYIMLIPLLVALYYHESTIPFLIGIILTEITGTFLWLRYKSDDEWKHKEAFAIVAFGWLTATVFGTIPFIASGISPVNALFESMAGFTATGATILDDIESHSKSILFWRSMIQWIGGMGIIVLFIAILPKLSIAGRHLFRAEAPVLKEEKLRPRIRGTAKILWMVYLVISSLQITMLHLAGMSLYDSIVHTFTTIGSAGFSPYGQSIVVFNSPLIEAILTLFMFIAGANFALLYRTVYLDHTSIFRDEEFKFYTAIVLVAAAVLTLTLRYDIYADTFTCLRYAMFQVVSIITTTGFASVDFNLWPDSSRIVLLVLMFIGGCAGSTSGGPKVVRVLLLLKYANRELFRSIHPRAVKNVKFNGKIVPDDIIHQTISFMIIYFLIFITSTFIVSLMDVDIITAFTASIATLGNIGPGFNIVGPMSSYNSMPSLAKLVMIANMWIGRLEVFTVIVLFTPEFWKK
ncbi:MAG: TrkH family potassium uptake protein [Methanomethylovorans sp.]|uniref:TrkH family potassium uptake protein n=1 Tax=Methanomethylovorans sp. TaxID=2758717 RepID=UPI003C755BAC